MNSLPESILWQVKMKFKEKKKKPACIFNKQAIVFSAHAQLDEDVCLYLRHSVVDVKV